MKLFSNRPLQRLPYLMGVLVLLLLHWLGRMLVLKLAGSPVRAASVLPFVTGVEFLKQLDDAVLLGWLVLGLVFTWLLTTLSLRRAADVEDREIASAAALSCLLPLVQIMAVLSLCLLPGRKPDPAGAASEAIQQPQGGGKTRHIAGAALIGMALSMVTMLIGVMLFRTYAYGVFVLTPFFVGVSGGYLVNSRADMGMRHTVSVVMLATLMSSLSLIVFALEGFLCVLMASPLVALAALFGALIGHELSGFAPGRRSNVAFGFVVVPLFLVFSANGEAPATFEVQSSVEIAAPPHAVWDALVQMETIEEEPGLPFRLGVAYPVRGVTYGEGVGAIRHGVFSTGVAVESVTEWEPDRVMAFRVLSDTPSMREISPYDEVHAPHLQGHFTTRGGRFTMEVVACGRTRLTESTRHELRIAPYEYWLPFARWIVKENHGRVLRHITRKAEKASGDTGC